MHICTLNLSSITYRIKYLFLQYLISCVVYVCIKVTKVLNYSHLYLLAIMRLHLWKIRLMFARQLLQCEGFRAEPENRNLVRYVVGDEY